MSYGQNNDGNSGMLVPGIAVAAVFGAAIYFFALKIPEVRAILLTLFTLLKVFGCLLTFHFIMAWRLIHLAIYILASPHSPNGVPSAARAYRVIMSVSPPSWLVGLVITVLAIIPFVFIKLNARGISEQKIVTTQQAKSLEDITKDWGIPAGILDVQDPFELAENFAQLRKDRNIPPSIFSRKIKNSMLSRAILHFERVLKYGEVFEKITDPDKLAKIIKRTMPGATETEKAD